MTQSKDIRKTIDLLENSYSGIPIESEWKTREQSSVIEAEPQQPTYSYHQDSPGGQTYGDGHSSQTLYITNQGTGEIRAYSDWTYMDAEDDEHLQHILHSIWNGDPDYGYEKGDYMTVERPHDSTPTLAVDNTKDLNTGTY